MENKILLHHVAPTTGIQTELSRWLRGSTRKSYGRFIFGVTRYAPDIGSNPSRSIISLCPKILYML